MTSFTQDFEETFGRLYSEEQLELDRRQSTDTTDTYLAMDTDFYVKKMVVDRRSDAPRLITVITTRGST